MIDLEKEIEDTVAMLPQQPPEETVKVLTDRGMLKGDALIYKVAWIPGENRKKKKVVQVHCTACGAVLHLEYVPLEEPLCSTYCYRPPYTFKHPEFREPAAHGSPTICPNCGAQAEVRHICSFGGEKMRLNGAGCVSVHEVNGHLAILSWIVEKCADKCGNICYSKYKEEGVILIGNKRYRVTGLTNYGCGAYRYHGWERRKKYEEVFGSCIKKHVIPFKRKMIYTTDNPNCSIYELINQSRGEIYPTIYLRLWQRYPALENIVKAGFGDLLSSLINEATSGSYYSNKKAVNENTIKVVLDLKKSKPSEMLKVTKQELDVAKQCDIGTLVLYRYLRDEMRIRLNVEYVKKARKLGGKALKELLERFGGTPIHTINYLCKQSAVTKMATPSYLRDYWEMLLNVYGEIPGELRYPRDLNKAHDEILKLQKEKEERELSEKILERGKEFEAFCFKNDDLQLMIRPCRSQAELIKEGKLLSHCVARYAGDVASGRTMIFFIRKMEFPNDPFYTLEFCNGKVVQNRGKSNCDRTKEVALFEKLWLAEIEKMKKQGERKKWKTWKFSR